MPSRDDVMAPFFSSTMADKQAKRERFEGVFSGIVDELLGYMKSQNSKYTGLR